MADQPPTPSGSRWEPDPSTAESSSAAASPPEESELPAPEAWAPTDDPAAAARRAQLRGRAILAGAATALTVGAGVAGFVIGHSTAGGNDFRPANFTGQFGGGQFGGGESGGGPFGGGQLRGGQPGNGQQGDGQQGPRAFGDRDGDGQPGPQPGTNGSSGSSSSSSGTGT